MFIGYSYLTNFFLFCQSGHNTSQAITSSGTMAASSQTHVGSDLNFNTKNLWYRSKQQQPFNHLLDLCQVVESYLLIFNNGMNSQYIQLCHHVSFLMQSHYISPFSPSPPWFGMGGGPAGHQVLSENAI